MIWNLILHIPVIMVILLFTWFSVRCSYGIQLTSKIGLFSTSRSSKTNLLKPLAVLGPLVLVDQKITNITDNGSWPNQIHFWLKYQEQKLKETFNIERFFARKGWFTLQKLVQNSCTVNTGRYCALLYILWVCHHSCSNHSNLEMEAECLTKTLSYLNLNISRTKSGRNKL